ncbi:MAG: glycerophosphodiester phosphodiesterase family protein [Bacteroidota bacterium]
MVYTDDTYAGRKVMVLGHRGMGELYRMPGNTYEAIYPVMGIGGDGAEVDVQMTRDSVLVLFHDDTMDGRTTCGGRVFEHDWSDIQQCKYYALENNIFVNSVDDVFSHLPDLHNWYFSFDCGHVDNEVADTITYRAQFLRAIKRLCEKYNMSDRVFLEGNKYLLLQAQQLGLTNKLFVYEGITSSTIDYAVANHFFGFTTSIEWLYDNVELAHQKGLYVMLWSPNNDAQNKVALKQKIDIIQTDDPIDLLRLLNRYNYDYVIP